MDATQLLNSLIHYGETVTILLTVAALAVPAVKLWNAVNTLRKGGM